MQLTLYTVCNVSRKWRAFFVLFCLSWWTVTYTLPNTLPTVGQNAVHGTMAGYTGFSVGLCNNKMCLLPIPELVATSPRQMNPKGRTWERILAVTRQPNTRALSRRSLLMHSSWLRCTPLYSRIMGNVVLYSKIIGNGLSELLHSSNRGRRDERLHRAFFVRTFLVEHISTGRTMFYQNWKW